VAAEYAEKGFKNVYALKDGVNGWKSAGYPVISG
jgi:rhodanese-related sulfurtransferase